MNRFQKTAILVGAAFIALGPALPQVFGVGQDYVRPWMMFSGVGQGMMKGAFTVTHSDGSTEVYTPLEIMSLERYPDIFSYEFDKILLNRDAMSPIVSEFCDAHVKDGATLSYSGKVGAPNGWALYEADDLCQKDDLMVAEVGAS
ncbi:MAG: hypothetical protein AAGG45_11055 [Pseudomonadota bacterium]